MKSQKCPYCGQEIDNPIDHMKRLHWRGLGQICLDTKDLEERSEAGKLILIEIQEQTQTDNRYDYGLDSALELPGLKYLKIEFVNGVWKVEVSDNTKGVIGIGEESWLPRAICLAWLDWQDSILVEEMTE